MKDLFDFDNITSVLKLAENLENSKSVSVFNLSDESKAILATILQKKINKKILFITSNEQKALKFVSDFERFLPNEVSFFPHQDISLYETGLNRNLYRYFQQFEILKKKPKLVVSTTKALLEKFCDEQFFQKYQIEIKKEMEIEPSVLSQKLVKLGFKRVDVVRDIGEFSLHGDILDVFDLRKDPLRIEFWGDSIVDIRTFNSKNQKSISHVENSLILPIFKFVNENQEEVFDFDPYFEGNKAKETKTLIELLQEYVIFFDESSNVFSNYHNFDKNYTLKYESNIKQDMTLKLESLNHKSFEDFQKSLSERTKVFLDSFIAGIDSSFSQFYFEESNIKSFASDEFEIAQYVQKTFEKGYRLWIATDFKKRVEEILKAFEIDLRKISFFDNFSLNGFDSETLNLVVLTDRELFNRKSKNILEQRFNYAREDFELVNCVNDIKENDYVVHKIHGIGRYLGLSKQEIDGNVMDYLTIEYANGDKLHIVAEQVNMLSRYTGVSSESSIRLSKMGGRDWKSIKNKTKEAVEEIAQELLNLYARRKITKGIQFDPDTQWQLEMEEAFPFTETKDQMQAILDVKNDMESAKTMDRLICADVGFGKTEVAIRAVFKAISSGMQACLVAPTTILALQHFETFKSRYLPFPVKVALLTRLQSSKEQKNILHKLKTGEIDFVIGTHRLLQNDVQFKSIGLLVIDEEHRFGVKHKEKLKNMRKNIDIISMSATPIPRTLYMSLSGIKDMSVINTAPQNRLPIKTYVGEMTDEIVKQAIEKELERNGQVYVLYNRVQTIDEFANSLSNLVKTARVKTAHGKMSPKELENKMIEFEQREFDVLVATTIIESGLDIENANTMIIIDSDRFGLAQLYQLRGRVGRCSKQAYCYCLYKKDKVLNEEAQKRLKAINEFTTLGSGYQIALRDVEIRGVGNILGTKQHGHMVNVGFETYCELLEQALLKLQGKEEKEEKESAIVDLKVSAFLPDDWIGNYDQKMTEYKRLSDVKNENELIMIESEWKDRFSKLPEVVENLIKLIRIRILATEANVSKIHQTLDCIRIYSSFTQQDWNIISKKLDVNIKKKLKFTIAPKSLCEANSILLLNDKGMNFDEIFNILTSLFYYINCVCSK